MQNLSLRTLFLSSLYSAMLLLALVIFAACGSLASEEAAAPTDAPEPTVQPSPTPDPRGGNLTIRLARDIPVLRPWQPATRDTEQVISLLYSGLMRLDDELRPQPDLAQRWQATPDGRTLTFTLRSGLTWHDGEPIDAFDVQYTLEEMRALPYTSTALLADLRRIAMVSVPASNTVVLSLTERYAPLLSQLTVPILPQHALAGRNLETTNFWEVPIGSGPFLFSEREPGQSIVLRRFDNYHHGAPLLDRVAFVGAASVDVALQGLQDEVLLLAEMPWNATRNLSETVSNVRMGTYPENGFYYLAFNLREGNPFADVRVRRALELALDIPRLVETATKGQGIPISSSAAPGSWADLTPPPPGSADLETARRLLSEAGWTLPEGATLRQREGASFSARLFVRGDDERRLVAAQRIAQVAASIGLEISVVPADFDTVIVSRYAPPYDFDLLLGSWLNGAGDPNFGDYAYYDPDDFKLFHSSEINQGQLDTRITRNFVGFSDPVYDNQSQAARQLYRVEERLERYRETQQRVANLLPYVYLWADRIPVVLNTRVTTTDGPVDLDTPTYLWNIERWYVE
jgi:peptide/nickel transport system substrate-binding protein